MSENEHTNENKFDLMDEIVAEEKESSADEKPSATPEGGLQDDLPYLTGDTPTDQPCTTGNIPNDHPYSIGDTAHDYPYSSRTTQNSRPSPEGNKSTDHPYSYTYKANDQPYSSSDTQNDAPFDPFADLYTEPFYRYSYAGPRGKGQGFFSRIADALERFASWVEKYIQAACLMVSMCLFVILLNAIDLIYIPGLNITLSPVLTKIIIIVLHCFPAFTRGFSGYERGCLYEVCCCLLPSEIILFLCFTQHQSVVALMLLVELVLGAVAVVYFAKRRLVTTRVIAEVSQTLLDELDMYARYSRKPKKITQVALRRYLVIVTAVLFAVPSLLTACVYGVDGVLEKGKDHAVIQAEAENQMMLNLDTIKQLDATNWSQLSALERINALQVVADIETDHLQIAPVTVVNKHISDQTHGYYQSEKSRVAIDMHKIGEDPTECLRTLLHECRHAYQQECVDAVDWEREEAQKNPYYETVRQWRYELEHHVDATKDFDEYYQQSTEQDARNYAEQELSVWQNYIYFCSLPSR